MLTKHFNSDLPSFDGISPEEERHLINAARRVGVDSSK